MKKEFKDFQGYFLKYQKQLGLMSYQIYFKYEPLKDYFASIVTDSIHMVATITLSNEVTADDKPFWDIRKSARHEALHLLLTEITDKAEDRYIRKGEIDEAAEALIHKLSHFIKWED